MELRECYAAAGADYEEAVRRFKNERRLGRFLRIFLRDQSFEKLCRAMEEADYEEAFALVHNLKGITMSLGLTELTEACIALTENLGSGAADEDTDWCFKCVMEQYGRTVNAVMEYLK